MTDPFPPPDPDSATPSDQAPPTPLPIPRLPSVQTAQPTDLSDVEINAERAAHAPSAAGGPPSGQRKTHPAATSVLLWGLASICLLLAPVAWVKGRAARHSYNQHPDRYTGKARIVIGEGLGIIFTLLIVAIAILVLLVGLDIIDLPSWLDEFYDR